MCEALTFMEWSTMVVPTYPEGVAATCARHQVVRVGRFVGLSQRLKEHTLLATVLRPIRLKPSR